MSYQEIKRLNEENEKLRDRLKSTEQKTSAFLEEKSRMREQLEKMQTTMKSRGNGGVSQAKKTPCTDIQEQLVIPFSHGLVFFYLIRAFHVQGDTAELERQLRQLKTDMEKVSTVGD